MDLSAYLSAQRFLGRNLRVRTRISESLRPFLFFLTMKKIFLLIFLCVISFNAIHADITWKLSDDGTLTISGTGDMEDSPWLSQSYYIKNVVIKNGVTSIGVNAFNNCYYLTSITIPNSVTSIGGSAFYGCSGLTSVTIPNSVTSIGYVAFSGCSSLTSVTIGNSVTWIGDDAFEGCSGLTSVHITDLVSWCKIKFNSWDANPLCYAKHLYINGKEVDNLVIPNGITKIENYAFEACSGLTSITIPNSVTSIGDCAFSSCI